MTPHLCSLVCASAVLATAAAVASAGRLVGAELTLGDRTFTFPDDYTLEVAAGPPLVDRPIEADFDPMGRLFVTESSGSNEPVEEQLQKKPHRVLRLTDTNGDGVFDARTVFADGLMFPEGCLWHEGSLYVSAPPQIWKLTDADDDGVAEKRDVWFDGKTLTGCANDLHGPYRGPDGLIYWCKGAFAEQTYDLPGKPGWKTTASHVFRARAGAKGPENIEPVFTAGMDNPVGLAWTPEGDLIVAGTFFQHPGGGQRDGLIHAVRGGVWGKDHDVLSGHPRTGDLMPPMTHLGPAAPAGLTRYGRDLLCAQFNMRKVSRHALAPDGATYKTTDIDFLSCDHPDFHPTDVFQAPDGSVLVIDTGGWYKLCCPTSQVAKPNVLGAVYRLRKKGGEVPVSVPEPRWAAADPASATGLITSLTTGSPHARREGAEAVAQVQLKAAVPTLMQALTAPDLDRFLFHAYTNALREISDAPGTRPGLKHDHPAVRAAALYALEQMPHGALTVEDVLPHLGAGDERPRQAALFVVERHAGWADGLAGWMRTQLGTPDAGGDTLRRVLVALGGMDRIRDLIGAELAKATSGPARLQLLGAMTALHLEQLPDTWRSGLTHVLEAGGSPERAAVLAVIRQASAESQAVFAQAIARIAEDAKTPAGLRLAALATLGGVLGDEPFRFVLTQLREAAHGSAAAEVLASRRLSPAQLRQVAGTFADAGLLERPVLLKSFAGKSDESAGLALVAALEKTHALAAAPPDTLRDTFAKFPEAVQKALAAAQAKSQAPDQVARLAELENTLPPGDIERGLIVFQSAKAACSTCHPVGYKGGNLGPDLSKVGAIRTRRDLIESLVFPSASFVRSYEPVQITKQDDTIAYGIVTNQGGDALTLATGAATPPVRVPRSDIKHMTPGTFSLMPQGLDQILASQELADVVAYLQSKR